MRADLRAISSVPMTDAAIAGSQSSPRSLRVLYVEPDRLDARILALLAVGSTLFRYGLRHVEGLREARAALARERFDLIIASHESDLAQSFLQGALLIGVPPILLLSRDPSAEGVAAGAPILAKARVDTASLDAVVETLLDRSLHVPS